ncbi:hypothetical protein OIO90_005228 [Microbotryomycetes sp. JL221]|nr:hypothetical protein OIO90_005228 [Microbotryomycetes sp. JL221]
MAVHDQHTLRGQHPDALAPLPLDPSASSSSSMAGNNNNRPNNRHGPKDVMQKILLAGVSNQVAACVTNPFDLVKVRQQLESSTTSINKPILTTTHPISATTTTASTQTMIHQTGLSRASTTPWYKLLTRMIKNEGPLSVYKGLSASLVREATYSGIRMGTYDGCKALVTFVGSGSTHVSTGSSESFGTKLFGGMLSGMLGSALANPADLLKVRMQTLGAQGTLRHHAKAIVSDRGLKGLYRAIGPTMVRAGILTSSQLGVYDHAKHTLMDDFPNLFREGFATHFAASGVAGFVCSATSSPVDVVKVRMMSSQGSNYRNALHCTASILKNEGPLAFYKGFTMCFLRLWPHSVLSLLVFEQLRRATGIAPI